MSEPAAQPSSAPDRDALAGSLGGDDSLVLPEFDAPPTDPIPLVQRWIADAFDRGVREPLAAALATVDADGRPSNRVLLLKAVDHDGVVFYGQYDSRKGRDIASVPFASVVLYWRETIQQLRIDGRVERLDDAASEALFATRLRAAQAAATASDQSRPLDGEDALRARFDAAMAGDDPIPRPEGWGGYRIVPEAIELWHGNRDRLHRRLRYTRDGEGWSAERLQP
ncbi:MAG: pyridoxamine 5'-phosphate oxidase [Patulibacter sp.]|nr:pyridoxamine 5'-phosphate oxidase [Patulibacter sp.]